MELNNLSTKNIMPDFYFESLSAALDGLRRSEILTDIVLRTEQGKTFALHRVVLIIGCPYFRNMLTEGVVPNQGIVSLPSEISADCMNVIIDYLYTGQASLPENIETGRKLLQAAKIFEMENFFVYVINIISNSITTENFSQIWDLADDFKDDSLRNSIISYVTKDLPYFTLQKGFLNLKVDRLKQIICSPYLEITATKNALASVLKWTAIDVTSRLPLMENELLPFIKFALIPKTDLEVFLTTELCVNFSKKLWKCIAETLYSRGIHVRGYQPESESVLSVKNSEICTVEEKDKLSCVSGTSHDLTLAHSATSDKNSISNRVVIVDVQELKVHDSNRFPLTQLANADIFKQSAVNKIMKPKTPRRRVWSSPLRIVVEGNEESLLRQDTSIMIMGWKKNGDAATHCFSLQTNIWTGAINLEETLASNAAWALHGNTLYLAGGIDSKDNVLKSTLIYNVEQNTFQLACRMNTARSSSNAAVLGWHMYVVGGLGHHRKPLNHVERYDILLDKWDVVESLPYSGWDIGVTSCEDKLWTFGGCCFVDSDCADNGWSLACHSYDPEVNQWINIGTLPDDFNNTVPIVASYSRKIYAISYYAPTIMWALDLATRKWQRLHIAVGSNTSSLRRTLAVLPYEGKLWVLDHCGKMLVFKLQTNSWEREYPFSRTITFPLYCAIVNLTVKD